MQPAAPPDLSHVTAVVLNWNSASDCIGLLRSLEGDFAAGLRLALVDNGSIDDSVARITRFLGQCSFGPSVELIPLPQNRGFTGGVNAGTHVALAAIRPPEYVVLINPDGEVEAGTIRELVNVAGLSAADVVASWGRAAVLDAWPRLFSARPHGLEFEQETPVLGRWRAAGTYGGACALFRAGLIRRLIEADGFFQDERLFLYWDEWDASLRARRFGARIVVSRDAFFRHRRAEVGLFNDHEFRDYYMARNSILLARRHLPRLRFWPAVAAHVLRDVSWRMRLFPSRRRLPLRAYLCGSWDGVRGKAGRWDRHPVVVEPEETPLPAARGRP